MSTFIWVPDRGYGGESEAKVTKAPFGDGYTARVASGLNSISDSVDFKMTGRSAAEVRAAVAFLREMKGVSSFDYTDHISLVTSKYICDTWKWSYEHEGNASLQATFERVYET